VTVFIVRVGEHNFNYCYCYCYCYYYYYYYYYERNNNKIEYDTRQITAAASTMHSAAHATGMYA